jgi:hypothetical protein
MNFILEMAFGTLFFRIDFEKTLLCQTFVRLPVYNKNDVECSNRDRGGFAI